MARPFKHPKTGVYWVRKVVPQRLRGVVGQTEFKRTLDTKDPNEAKRRVGPVLDAIQARIDDAVQGETFGFNDILALSAEHRRERKRQLLDQAAREPWRAEDFDNAEHGLQMVVEDARPYGDPDVAAARWGASRLRSLLDRKNLSVPSEFREQAACRIYLAERDALADARHVMLQDNTPPAPANVSPTVGRAVSIAALFDKYAAAEQLGASTRSDWRRHVEHFEQWLKGRPAHAVTSADVFQYADHLRETGGTSNRPLKVKTINEGYLAAIGATYAWAEKRGKVSRNPAHGVKLKQGRGDAGRSNSMGPYTDDEVAAILAGVRADHRDYVRWCPWLCAFTGARISELLNARKEDVGEVSGTPFLHIRDGKTAASARMVPLHPAIVGDGFLEYVKTVPDGDFLFPGEWSDQHGNRTKTPANRLRETIQRIVPKRPGIAPNHSFRHWLIQQLRRARVNQDVVRQLSGHSPADVHAGYGRDDVPGLYEAVCKVVSPLPR